MKTSNKILIAFATALILIPVLGMVIVSATQYKKGNYTDPAHNFNNQKNGLSSITINKPFSGIDITDGKLSAVTILYEKSLDYGISVDGVDKNDLKWNVNSQGILQISYTGKDVIARKNFLIRMFSPTFKFLKANSIAFLVVTAPADSLDMEVSNTDAISFTRPYPQENTATATQPLIKHLKLKLHNSVFNDRNSYTDLNLSMSGNSAVTISNDDFNKNSKGKIANLKINTLDSAIVNFENIEIERSSGSFSNKTQVKMPAVNLNQMFKK